MFFDVNAKSTDLLERLANSIYDRNPDSPNLVCFNLAEVHIVENWLRSALKDYDALKAENPDSI